MKLKNWTSLVMLVSMLTLAALLSVQAQQPQDPPKEDEQKSIEKAITAPVEKDPRVQSDGKPWGINKATVSDPTRPRVLLIGDSILSGYSYTVIKQLEGKAYVDYWVTPACQGEAFNKMLKMVLTNGPYDVIHINLGLHGFQRDRVVEGMAEKQPRIPDGQYEPLTKSFIEVMRKENPKGRIIWASTTQISLRDKPAELDPQLNPIIVEHNRMAAKVMAEMNVPVNDLYSLMTNHFDLKQNDFHWKDAARKIQGEAVAEAVIKQLEAKKLYDESLAMAIKPRTADSASTPAYAVWHQKENDRIMEDLKKRNGDVNLLLVGDSITALWPSKGPKSYETFLPWKTLNMAICAEKTEHILYRLLHGNINGIKPKAAMVLIGTNNLGQHLKEKPEWVAAGVKKILEVIHAQSPETKILLLALFPRGAENKDAVGFFKNTKPTDSIRVRVVETNKLLAQLADNKKIFFMDIGDMFVDADGSVKTDLFPDNLHPNEAGYKLWIDAVKPKLEELMK